MSNKRETIADIFVENHPKQEVNHLQTDLKGMLLKFDEKCYEAIKNKTCYSKMFKELYEKDRDYIASAYSELFFIQGRCSNRFFQKDMEKAFDYAKLLLDERFEELVAIEFYNWFFNTNEKLKKDNNLTFEEFCDERWDTYVKGANDEE